MKRRKTGKKQVYAFMWLCISTILGGCAIKQDIGQLLADAKNWANDSMLSMGDERLVPEEYIPEIVDSSVAEANAYAYKLLNDTEKQLYQEIYSCLALMQAEKKLSTTDPVLLDYVFSCVMNDHPEFFYVEGYRYTTYSIGSKISSITFIGVYSMEYEEVLSNIKEIDAYVQNCMAGMPQVKDEYTIVKYFYEYIVNNTTYDLQADNNQNICSVFVTHESVCQGYAKALQYLLHRAGIEATLVTGYTWREGSATQEGHAWNLVRVDDSYYYVDVTWGDPIYGNQSEDMVTLADTVNYDYLLITTEELLKTHTIENVIEMPECKDNKDNYYVREGLLLDCYDEKRISDIFRRAYQKEEKCITIKCNREETFEQMKYQLLEKAKIFQFLQGHSGSVSYMDNEQHLTLTIWI